MVYTKNHKITTDNKTIRNRPDGRTAVIKNKSDNNCRDFESFVLANNEHIIVLSIQHIHTYETVDVSNNYETTNKTNLAPTF